MQLIVMEAVGKSYVLGETRVQALEDVNLTIAPGEFIAVWGPSGSGKSTLCNMIGLTDCPTSGRLFFNGQPLDALNDDQRSDLRNRQLGFIFQSFNLIPVLTALDNVMLPLQIQGMAGRPARAKARSLLEEFGLAEHAGHRPAKLSGGQQQRVAIARALITEPLLVVADEPTANLDSENALKIIDLMRRINGTQGTTFVFSTHDDRLLERVRRRVHLRDGRIVQQKETEQ